PFWGNQCLTRSLAGEHSRRARCARLGMSELHGLPAMHRSVSLPPRQRRECTAMLLHELKQPTSFLCPISHQSMHDPLLLADGHTYERQRIELWLPHATTSPVTGLELS
ncbi:unnamed protein product, partial [Prorocentrum cordatum]